MSRSAATLAPLPGPDERDLRLAVNDDAAARALRDRSRGAVEKGIEALIAYRETDPDRPALARLRRGFRGRRR